MIMENREKDVDIAFAQEAIDEYKVQWYSSFWVLYLIWTFLLAFSKVNG